MNLTHSQRHHFIHYEIDALHQTNTIETLTANHTLYSDLQELSIYTIESLNNETLILK